jgi:hypothetical protein
MSALAGYLFNLKQLQKRSSVTFTVQKTQGGLLIGGILFKPVRRLGWQSLNPTPPGILIKNLSEDEESYCRARRISFFTSHGKLHLVTPNFLLDLESVRQKKARAGSAKRVPVARAFLPPTTLISPNGCDILDVLFRLPQEKLAEFSSALSFVRSYHLSQPKLSIMMSRLKVAGLPELKEQIRALPDSWWTLALRYPLTRKRLTPFFEEAKIYRSLHEDSPQETLVKLNDKLRNLPIFPGPTEVAKELGFIRDTDIYLWVLATDLQDLKTSFRLIPEQRPRTVAWHLAPFAPDLSRSKVMSPLARGHEGFLFSNIKSNLFCSIWDLGFGDERLREVQISVLRKVLDEVR